jgi:hypothetical protein
VPSPKRSRTSSGSSSRKTTSRARKATKKR